MSATVCHLSKREVGRLENYCIEPNHREHMHIPLRDAMQGIKEDTMRAVGNTARLRAVCDQDSNNRRWRGRPSGNYQVLQLVRVLR